MTVLLADVEGSVTRWEQDPAAMTASMAAFHRAAAEVIAAHRGVCPEEQGEGDSFVAAFADPAAAIGCAVVLQQRLLAGPDGTEPLAVRMAIHTAHAQLRDHRNYEGTLMNRAARLRTLAYGGQVLASGTTRELLPSTVPSGAGFIDLGVHRLRDVREPFQVWQVAHPSLPAVFPPLAAIGARLTNLPRQLTTFVGRATELQAVSKLLHENRLVTFTGPGGTGKTRLAIELAADVLDGYAAGVWFVDLGAITDPEDVGPATAGALRLPDDARRTPLERVTTHLGDRAALVVIDNCEHLIGAAATFIDGLLRGCSNVDVLTTSREPLRVSGESIYVVPGLTLPDDRSRTEPEVLADYDAVRLFADRAALADPGFELDPETLSFAASIADRVDALPLAIELAAARVRSMPIAEIDASLTLRFDLLRRGARQAPDRQQSLQESIEWSLDLLDDGERAVFGQLAVFTGTFTLEAVAAVCGPEAVDIVLDLFDKSLMTSVADGRYRLLAPVRAIAIDRLRTSGDDVDDLERRRLDHLLALAAASSEMLDRRERHWIEAIGWDLPNIEAALAWGMGHDPETAARLAAALVPFSIATGTGRRCWLEWLAPLLSRDLAGLDATARADVAYAAGLVTVSCGELAILMQAPQQLATAAERYQEVGDPVGLARANGFRGALEAYAGGRDAGLARWQASIDTLNAAGDTATASLLLSTWGGLLVQQGRPAEGLAHVERAAALADPEESSLASRKAHEWLAVAHGALGHHDVAAAIAERCLAECEAAAAHGSPNRDEGCILRSVLAAAAHHRGQLEVALRYATDGAEAGARVGHGPHEALCHSIAALVARDEHDLERAHVSARRAFDAVGDPASARFMPRHAVLLAETLADLGRNDEATAVVDTALRSTRQFGQSIDLARLLRTAARLHLEAGDDDSAEDCLFEALGCAVVLDLPAQAIPVLESLAAIAVGVESDAEALRLVGAAGRAREDLGRRPADAGRFAAARARLGDDGFDRAIHQGAGMTLAEALEYASRGRGTRKRPSTGWSSLTPTEREVVRHVQEGLTNPQIGERMFISKGTVRTRLTHIFTKLDVSTRSQLAAEATARWQ